VLTVTGELDVSNTNRFDRSVHGLASAGDPFIIDVRDVSFIGVQCVQLLFSLDARRRATRTRWALVTDPAMQSLFDIGDPDAVLPVTNSLS
jgi:anti-anti-sigma factor